MLNEHLEPPAELLDVRVRPGQQPDLRARPQVAVVLLVGGVEPEEL
jgi:hypothetical protein